MHIRQLMNQPVVTCHPEDSLEHAASLMWNHDCGALPVVDDQGRLTGMITDRDICMAAYTQGVSLGAAQVASAMSRQVHSAGADDDVAAVEALMRQHQVRRVPVVDNGHNVVGVLSINDLVRESRRGLSQRKPDVPADEFVSTLAAICAPREPQQLARAS